MKKALFLFAISLFFSVISSAQISSPQTPHFGGFNPVIPQQQKQMPAFGQQAYPSPTPTVVLGGSAESVRNSEQRKSLSPLQQTEELQALLSEARQQPRHNSDASYSPISNKDPHFQKLYAERNAAYTEALRSLKQMLAGSQSISIADAYFITESAYGEPYLTKAEFDNILDQSAAFIREWMKQNNLDTSLNDVKNLAVQRFMSDTLTIKNSNGKHQVHKPYFYDYEDFTGEKDYRNLFVTKCLTTGGGQCASMPIVYLMLAERLNAQAYLTVVPQHSFVKYPCSDGTIRNYEPTSNWEITDQWYADHMFISPDAIKYGLFLDTFNRQQVVADCILDLAQSYIIRVGVQMGIADGDFVKACIRLTVPYFPRNNNFLAIGLHSSVLKAELMTLLDHSGIKDASQISQHPQALSIWKAYQYNERYLTALGYQPIPDGMYQDMMNQQEFKGRLQRVAGQNGKQNRSLFNSAATR